MKQRKIQAVQNQNNERQTSMRDIVRGFSDYILRKYVPIQVDEQSIRELTQAGYGRPSDEHRETLEAPITEEELRAPVFEGDSKKSPSNEGIEFDCFKILWEELAKTLEHSIHRCYGTVNCQRNKNKGSSSVYQNARNPKHQRIIGP